MNAEKRMFISRLLTDEPELDAAITWAKRLSKLLRRRVVDDLDEVLTAAAHTLFGRFAASLRHSVQSEMIVLKNPTTGEIKECKNSGASLFSGAQTLMDNSAARNCAAWYLAAGFARMN
jgi:signal transduction histidine kinase